MLKECEKDVRIAAASGASVLISACPEVALELALEIASRSLHRPSGVKVLDCRMADGVTIASVLRQVAAEILMLQEVHVLTAADQQVLTHALDEWPKTGPRPRLMASTSAALYELVQQGSFEDRLYYRLNAITVDAEHADADDA